MNIHRLLPLSLTAVLLLSLAACGKNSTAAETAAEPRTFAAAESTAAESAVPETKAPETEAPSSAPETQAQAQAETEAEPEDAPVTPIQIIVEAVSKGITDPETYAAKTSAKYFRLLPATEEDRKAYPALASSFEAYNKEGDLQIEKTEQELLEMYEDTAQYREPEYMEGMYMCQEDEGFVTRADSRAVSVLSDCYTYYGGVHPDRYYSGVNFDTETGKELLLKDIVKDQQKFFEIVDEKLQTDYADIYENMVDVPTYIKDCTEDGNVNIPWTMTNEGVTVYFNSYCLGSYAMGPQFITVYFDEAPELFNERYTELPSSYVLPVQAPIPLSIDCGSGSREQLYVEAIPLSEDEYPSYKWIVHCGNRSLTIDDWCYYHTSYVVAANGKYYLYLFETSDNDYSILAVVDLETMRTDPESHSNFGLVFPYGSYDSDDSSYTSVDPELSFTDPECFMLNSRFDLLGTFSGYKTYHTGSDGMPVSDDKWHTLHSGMVYVTKRPLEVNSVDETGKTLSSFTIPEGVYLHPIRSDGKTWMDVQEIDKNIVEGEITDDYSYLYVEDPPAPDYTKPVYRIEVEKDGWQGRIGGLNEDECLYGISYAG